MYHFRGVARSMSLDMPSEVQSYSQELLMLELTKVVSFTFILKGRGTYELSYIILKFSLTDAETKHGYFILLKITKEGCSVKDKILSENSVLCLFF